MRLARSSSSLRPMPRTGPRGWLHPWRRRRGNTPAKSWASCFRKESTCARSSTARRFCAGAAGNRPKRWRANYMQDSGGWMAMPARSFSARCRRSRESARQSATGCARPRDSPPLLLPRVAQLVHILDGGLIDQRLAPAAHFDSVAVVPLDAAFDLLAIFENHHHRRLRLDLLLQIEQLRMAIGRIQVLGL